MEMTSLFDLSVKEMIQLLKLLEKALEVSSRSERLLRDPVVDSGKD